MVSALKRINFFLGIGIGFASTIYLVLSGPEGLLSHCLNPVNFLPASSKSHSAIESCAIKGRLSIPINPSSYLLPRDLNRLRYTFSTGAKPYLLNVDTLLIKSYQE